MQIEKKTKIELMHIKGESGNNTHLGLNLPHDHWDLWPLKLN